MNHSTNHIHQRQNRIGKSVRNIYFLLVRDSLATHIIISCERSFEFKLYDFIPKKILWSTLRCECGKSNEILQLLFFLEYIVSHNEKKIYSRELVLYLSLWIRFGIELYLRRRFFIVHIPVEFANSTSRMEINIRNIKCMEFGKNICISH